MYINDTTVYRSTSEYLDYKCWKLISLTSDLALTAQWEGDNCFVSFNTSKMKLVTFHHRANPEFTDEWYTFNEAPCLERLLGSKLIPDPKLKSYICAIDKVAVRMATSLYRSSKCSCYHALFLQESGRTRNGVLLPYPGWSTLTVQP